jgi:glycosyltransferase involved in cell wall biosynthesis
MPTSPAYSIVIPTRNRAGMAEHALRSVLAQTLGNCEIVIVDDGSTDATPERLAQFRTVTCQVIRHDSSRGVSAARNHGVSAASGEFIVFLDDDDELRPNALQALDDQRRRFPQLEFLWGGRMIHEKDSAGNVIATRTDDWSGVACPISGSAFLELALDFATNSAFAIRRSLFEQLGGFDEALRVSEDRDLFIRLAQGNHQGAAVPVTVIDVNETSNSLSRNDGLRSGADTDLRVIAKHRQFLDRPEHREFENKYLLSVFLGFLQAGNRKAAMLVFRDLRRRGAIDSSIFRKYLRHAPEFRALKALVRYNAIRRLRLRLRRHSGRAKNTE